MVIYGGDHKWAVYPVLEKEGYSLVGGKWLGREKRNHNESAIY